MDNSNVISPQHLSRKAVIYIRQSTPHQAISHQESLRLQYALTERARELGWSPDAIEVSDMDVGLSAASASHRAYSVPLCTVRGIFGAGSWRQAAAGNERTILCFITLCFYSYSLFITPSCALSPSFLAFCGQPLVCSFPAG